MLMKLTMGGGGELLAEEILLIKFSGGSYTNIL